MNVTSYEISGLLVRSEFELPTAAPCVAHEDDSADVVICFCDDVGSPIVTRFENPWVVVGERDFVFRPRPGLSFRVRNGREVLICRGDDVPDNDVNLFLIGSAWGVLCHQRSLLPLHCSAVQSGAMAFAFIGASGAGKSTLAAGLAKRGYTHLCDDVCVVDLSADKAALWPMPKGLKLWRDAADMLGLERGAMVGSDSRLDKFYVSLSGPDTATPVRNAALYVLDETSGSAPRISKLRGSAHFLELYSCVYRSEWLSWIRDPKEVFIQISKLSRELDVYRFSRPKDMARFNEGLDLLEGHMVDVASKGKRVS